MNTSNTTVLVSIQNTAQTVQCLFNRMNTASDESLFNIAERRYNEQTDLLAMQVEAARASLSFVVLHAAVSRGFELGAANQRAAKVLRWQV